MVMRSVWIVLLTLLTNTSFAQRETSNWVFGFYCGLNFEQGDVIPINNTAVKTKGGSAVISDKITGELLFYTDGRNFWNRNHQLMENAHTLPYNCTTRITQPAIIIPSTTENSIFHVFCIRAAHEVPPPNDPNNCPYAVDKTKIPEGESGLNLYYYQIDTKLDDGLGNVVESESNLLLQTNITEKLTAVPHANGHDVWVIVHGWKNNTFYAHHWTEEGVVDVVTTHIGSVHGDYGGIYFEDELRGELKASPDGRKIASAVFSDYRPFDLFDFNAATGVLSNYVNLGDVRGQYGVSFSPDNSKLYVNADSRDPDTNLLNIVLQYDMLSGNDVAIAASGKSIIVGNPYTNIPGNGIFEGWSTVAKGMALAPDGRLYISGNEPEDGAPENHVLVMIENPNERLFDCNINYHKFTFGLGRTGKGLPNFMQSYFHGLKPISECRRPSALNVYPNPTIRSITVDLLEGCSIQYSLTVFNTLGQALLYKDVIVTGEPIDLSDFSNGLYILKFEGQNNQIVKRILKNSSGR